MHSPVEIDWGNLPEECIMQMHWHPWPAFRERLRNHNFQIVALARHPLDVLISILQFAIHEPTSRWLEGEGGNESTIFGAMPRSAAFLEYATGSRARALLSVTPEWWFEPGCVQVHYESLVDDPGQIAKLLIEELGGRPKQSVADVLASTSLANLRKQTQSTGHFWQGKPGLWRSFFTTEEADLLFSAHRQVFEDLGYHAHADAELTPSSADANWIRLAWHGVLDDLHDLRILKRDFASLRSAHEATRAELEAIRNSHQRSSAEAATLREELAKAHSFIAQCEGLGPRTLKWVRRIKRVGDRILLLPRLLKSQ
jgi:hypothetical protein